MFKNLRVLWLSTNMVRLLGLEDEVTFSDEVEIGKVIKYKTGESVKLGPKSHLLKQVNDAAKRSGVLFAWVSRRFLALKQGLFRKKVITFNAEELRSEDFYLLFGDAKHSEKMFYPADVVSQDLPLLKERNPKLLVESDFLKLPFKAEFFHIKEVCPIGIPVSCLEGSATGTFLFGRLTLADGDPRIIAEALFFEDDVGKLYSKRPFSQAAYKFWQSAPSNSERVETRVILDTVLDAVQSEIAQWLSDVANNIDKTKLDSQKKLWERMPMLMSEDLEAIYSKMSELSFYEEKDIQTAIERFARSALLLRLQDWNNFARAANAPVTWDTHLKFHKLRNPVIRNGFAFRELAIQLVTGESEPFILVEFIGEQGVTKAPVPRHVVAENLVLEGKVLSTPFSFHGPLKTITKADLWAKYVIPLGVWIRGVENVEFNPVKIDEWGVA